VNCIWLMNCCDAAQVERLPGREPERDLKQLFGSQYWFGL
jgi:hypothetical protein